MSSQGPAEPYLTCPLGLRPSLTPSQGPLSLQGPKTRACGSPVAEKPLWGQGMLPVQFPKTGPGLVLRGAKNWELRVGMVSPSSPGDLVSQGQPAGREGLQVPSAPGMRPLRVWGHVQGTVDFRRSGGQVVSKARTPTLHTSSS